MSFFKKNNEIEIITPLEGIWTFRLSPGSMQRPAHPLKWRCMVRCISPTETW